MLGMEAWYEENNIKSKDNYKLNLHIFETASKSTKGYIQVIHGMEEHQERYKNFAEILNKAGYTVITSDMRGHGVNAPELGFLVKRMVISIFFQTRKELQNI